MFGLVITAATQEQLDWPGFEQVMTNWRQMAKKIIIVIGSNTVRRNTEKVRYVVAKGERVMLHDVITVALSGMDGVSGPIVVTDPMVVMRFGIFDIFGIAARRQLGNAWMASGLALKLKNYMEADDIEPQGLRWFCSTENVWTYVLRNCDPKLPMIDLMWGGSIATWAYKHLHSHKYHDVTELRALALMNGPGNPATEEETAFWSQKATFQPPMKNFVRMAVTQPL